MLFSSLLYIISVIYKPENVAGFLFAEGQFGKGLLPEEYALALVKAIAEEEVSASEAVKGIDLQVGDEVHVLKQLGINNNESWKVRNTRTGDVGVVRKNALKVLSDASKEEVEEREHTVDDLNESADTISKSGDLSKAGSSSLPRTGTLRKKVLESVAEAAARDVELEEKKRESHIVDSRRKSSEGGGGGDLVIEMMDDVSVDEEKKIAEKDRERVRAGTKDWLDTARKKGELADLDDEDDVGSEGCTKCMHAFERKFGNCFYRIGHFDGKHPWIVVAIVLFICILFAGGMANFSTENRADKLWIPQDTPALRDRDIFEEYFPRGPRRSNVILTWSEDNGNILSINALRAAMQLHEKIVTLQTSVEVEGVNVSARTWDFESLCLKTGQPATCLRGGLLSLWDWSLAALNNDTDVLNTINTEASTSLIESLGDVKRDASEKIVSAAAMRLSYTLENRAEVVSGRDVDKPAEQWEDDFLVLTRDQDYGALSVAPSAERSLSDEFGAAISGDVQLLSIGYLLIIIYVMCMLGRRSFVFSRIWLTLGSVLSIGLSIVSSMGLCSAAGIFYGPVHSVLPFLLLGIGVDDSFIICNAFDRTDPSWDMPKRIGETMRSAGTSITVTSLTNFVAFAIGSTTSLPALSSFCLYAAVGVFMIYFTQITFFAAITSLDARRREANRLECCCCCHPCHPCCEPHERFKAALTVDGEDEKHCFGKMETSPCHLVTRFMLLTPVSIIIVIFTCLLAIGGVYGALQLQQDFSFTWFVPSDSYLLENINLREQYFDQNGQIFFVVTEEFDYWERQEDLRVLQRAVEDSEWTRGEVTGWFPAFENHLRVTNQFAAVRDRDAWFSNLTFYLETAGSRYKDDVVFSDDTKSDIRLARLYGTLVDLVNASQEVDGMEGVRAAVAIEDDLPVFAFTFNFLFSEQYAVILREAIQNVLLALAAVLLISTLLLPHPIVSLSVFACVLFTVADLLGVMWLWDVSVDSVAVVNVTLGTALAVDYAAHVGHAFLVERGGKHEKAFRAIVTVGFAVFNGAFSTFLAIVVLAFSTSYVFTVFFKILFSVAVFGVYHGLVFLPALLSLIGPSRTTLEIKMIDE